MRLRLKNIRGNIFTHTGIWTMFPWNWRPVCYQWSMLNLFLQNIFCFKYFLMISNLIFMWAWHVEFGVNSIKQKENCKYVFCAPKQIKLECCFQYFLGLLRELKVDAKSTPSYSTDLHFSVFQDRSETGALHLI